MRERDNVNVNGLENVVDVEYVQLVNSVPVHVLDVVDVIVLFRDCETVGGSENV
jgi:hypothetical protein